MPRFIVSFYSDSAGMRTRILESASAETAVREFFEKHQSDYTRNDEGFAYFREDFEDADKPMGSVIELP